MPSSRSTTPYYTSSRSLVDDKNRYKSKPDHKRGKSIVDETIEKIEARAKSKDKVRETNIEEDNMTKE